MRRLLLARYVVSESRPTMTGVVLVWTAGTKVLVAVLVSGIGLHDSALTWFRDPT
jgi:hypothetical protein